MPLSKDQQRRLTQKLEQAFNRTVQATYTVDPSVLGGVVVEMDGKVLDGSLRQRYRDLKDVMHT